MMPSIFLNVEFNHMLQRRCNDVTLQLCRVFIINITTVNVKYLCLPYSELLDPSQPYIGHKSTFQLIVMLCYILKL